MSNVCWTWLIDISDGLRDFWKFIDSYNPFRKFKYAQFHRTRFIIFKKFSSNNLQFYPNKQTIIFDNIQIIKKFQSKKIQFFYISKYEVEW